MALYIGLIDLTDRGAVEIHDTTTRADAFVESVKDMGITVRQQFWTLGRHDGVLVFEAPDDRIAAASMLELESAGRVRCEVLRAFDRAELSDVLSKLE